MATADELLAATMRETTDVGEIETDTEILVADLNTRVIVIPATIRILGVEHDDDVKRLQFKTSRYYGEFDLSTFNIQINFENANGVGDIYSVTDVTVEEDTIAFTWLVDRVAFEYAGNVKFSISMQKYTSDGEIESALNTAIATLPVLDGLMTSETVVSSSPGVFDQLMFRLYAVEAATGKGQDGYYSVVKVTQDDSGVLFSIINQDGETIAYVKHGTTPVRGVDYWTEEDKIEIEQTVLNYTKQCVDYWAPAYKTVLLTSAAWRDGVLTVAVDGVTADNIVIVTPSHNTADYDAYITNNIRCISQGAGTLTFECGAIPTTNILVNVAVFHDKSEFSFGSITVTDDGEGNVTIL